VKSNKNDFIDAEAIAEAVERKNMRFVPIKTDDQLDLQAIHRVRDRLTLMLSLPLVSLDSMALKGELGNIEKK
jgi:transposase